MHPIPELTSLLKQLCLSGDEVVRRSQKTLAQRMRRTNFRNQKTLDWYDINRLPA